MPNSCKFYKEIQSRVINIFVVMTLLSTRDQAIQQKNMRPEASPYLKIAMQYATTRKERNNVGGDEIDGGS